MYREEISRLQNSRHKTHLSSYLSLPHLASKSSTPPIPFPTAKRKQGTNKKSSSTSPPSRLYLFLTAPHLSSLLQVSHFQSPSKPKKKSDKQEVSSPPAPFVLLKEQKYTYLPLRPSAVNVGVGTASPHEPLHPPWFLHPLEPTVQEHDTRDEIE